MGVFRKEEKKRRGGIFGFHRKKPWIFWGVVVSLFSAFVFGCFYEVFRANAERHMDSPVESQDNIAWLYQSCYLLYRDLKNSQHEDQLDYNDIYLDVPEKYKWILEEGRLREYLEYLEERESGTEDGGGEERSEAGEGQTGETGETGEKVPISQADCSQLEMELRNLSHYFESLEDSFQVLNNGYDYIIRDDKTGKYVTNMSAEDRNRSLSDQYFRLSFTFDSAGNVTVGDDICGHNESLIRKYANGALRDESLQVRAAREMETFYKYANIIPPVDCTVIFGISRTAWEEIEKNSNYGEIALYINGYGLGVSFHGHYYGGGSASVMAYLEAGVGGILLLVMLGIAVSAVLLPVLGGTKPWKEKGICAIPFEAVFAAGCILTALGEVMMKMIAGVASGRAQKALQQYTLLNAGDAETLTGLFNLLVLTLYFFCCWYVGICARAVRDLGIREYVKQKSLIYRFFPFVKSRVKGAYENMTHLDLTENAHKTIIRILLVNGAVLILISFFWVGGIALTLVYSVILYFVLRKYVSELQEKYRILLKAVDEIAEGRLDVSINGDLGIFEPFRKQVFKIQDGLQKAVDTEFRSQKMKVELITNMSHDLKTPLTAIITYVNLLKDGNLTEEQRREYLATLEQKSLRLKSLIEDLFEFSKASSNNVTLNIMDVDIMNLVKQVAFEMSDKTRESGLDVRISLTDEKVILPLDSQKTYRIYENLFGNIAKYALKGTRVYINGFRIDDTVIITLKNISAQEITVEASELTERFVRGDASRNTEGSGLGLAIAKSFMELQGGELELEVDGDLFKATTTWRIRTTGGHSGSKEKQ